MQNELRCSVCCHYGRVTLNDSIAIFLIDLFRLFVYDKPNYIVCKMKRKRFTEIYL